MDAEGVGFDAAEELLLTADFEDLQNVWAGSNYVFACRMCAGEQTFAAIYKPHRGEAPLWDFEGGLYRREVAAYRLSRLLDWTFIPPTVIREGPRGVGALQLFIGHDPAKHYFVQREDPEIVPQLQRMCVFDYVVNNADRKGGHCLLDADGVVWGIDHGLCFHESFKLRSVIWDWAGERIPDSWLADVERVGLELAAREPRTDAFRDLISESELDALLARADRLLRTKKYPTPGANRHYPWPLV